MSQGAIPSRGTGERMRETIGKVWLGRAADALFDAEPGVDLGEGRNSSRYS